MLEGLDYYNSSRDRQILLRIEAAYGPGAGRAVQTLYHDRTFYIPRLRLVESEGIDRTLKTLSFLDQLIALQTSESTIRNAQPFIAIQQ